MGMGGRRGLIILGRRGLIIIAIMIAIIISKTQENLMEINKKHTQTTWAALRAAQPAEGGLMWFVSVFY